MYPKFALKGFLMVVITLVCWSSICCNQKKSENDSDSNTALDHERTDEVEKAYEFEQMMLIDPSTGKIPSGVFEAELRQAETISAQQRVSGILSDNSYGFAGP